MLGVLQITGTFKKVPFQAVKVSSVKTWSMSPVLCTLTGRKIMNISLCGHFYHKIEPLQLVLLREIL